ncbi:MAG: hypothetical protein PHX44_06125 [Sulfurimonas sp.]|uniref:hypothetical protein n=1 Tax=Sulfurimonas sp. TaxID=2022749 RepID=UPI00261E2010|nr:hypothetical protein [Sulfurimonas sp.]MDD2652608.1 hypothetical protein [Sulfurimonas sp.]MDD3450750.1 hypothetical protein [Sulfurimonas sp.]
MQRSLSYKNPLTPYFYGVLFLFYTALSGIYLFLPPLLAILYFYFSKALKKEDSGVLFLVIFCLLLFEAANGYVLFSTVIYFFLLHKYVVPKITQSFNCAACIRFIVVLLVYLGFFLFYSLLSNIFMFPTPSISYYVIYYIAIEFLIMSVL